MSGSLRKRLDIGISILLLLALVHVPAMGEATEREVNGLDNPTVVRGEPLISADSNDGFLYVRDDGGGEYPNIQAAIDASVNGDVILLDDGVYTGAGNRGIEYRGKAITVRSQGGNPESCVIDCQGLDRAFFFNHDEGAGALLEGVTITHGVAPSNEHGEHWGGAIACATNAAPGAIPTIRNCVFLDNSAATGGGGIYTSGDGGLIDNCRFFGNSTGGGGGGASVCSAIPTFHACLFEGNTAGQTGGGIHFWYSSTGTVENCTFRDNEASYGGGVGGDNGFNTSFVDCLFEANHCLDRGGAVFAQYGASPVLTGCVLVRNRGDHVQYGDGGSALWCSDGSPSLQNCTISDNASPTAAVVVGDSGVLTIDRCIIAHSSQGKAVWLTHYGGPSMANLACTDVYGNAGGDWTGGIDGQADINGNFTADPLFCERTAGNYSLSQSSRCLAENNPDCGLIGALELGCMVPLSADETYDDAALFLDPAVPNPFTSTTVIRYQAATSSGDVQIGIHDLQGRRIRGLHHNTRGSGPMSVEWDGTDGEGNPVPSGTYFAVLKTNERTLTTRLVLIR